MNIKVKVSVAFSLIAAALFIPVSTFAATLSLSPSAGTFNRGCSYAVKINLDTQSAITDGTDAILFYEASKFNVTTSSITNGTIYPDYPGNVVDSQAGKIAISGLASVSQGYSGSGTLATINFKVNDNAPAGVTTIRFDFDPNNKGKTTDSNVVERGTVVDVLNSVTDGSYTIGTGSSCVSTGGEESGTGTGTGTGTSGTGTGSTVGSSGTSGGTSLLGRGGTGATGSGTFQQNQSGTQKTIDNVVGGKAGITQPTIILTTIGVILTVLGIAGLALL